MLRCVGTLVLAWKALDVGLSSQVPTEISGLPSIVFLWVSRYLLLVYPVWGKRYHHKLIFFQIKLAVPSNKKGSVQFSSVAQLCPTLCDSMNHSMPGLPVHHQLPEFTQTQHPLSQWCHPAISSSVVPFSACPQCLPASGSFPVGQLFTWGGQVLEFQPQHQSFQWTPKTDLL